MGKLKKHKKSDTTAKWSESAINSDELFNKQNEEKHIVKNKSTKIGPIKQKAEFLTKSEELNDEIREPTLEELKESEKPENIMKLKSCRTKKKEKYVKKIENNKLNFILQDINRNKEYLTKWKKNRSEWKFEKLRQISIQNSIFDKEKINDNLWPIALDYLSSSKGQSKNKIIELAEVEINKSDKEIEETENHEIINDTKYRRAREILQSFD